MSFQINGIGPKTEDKLHLLDISTDLDLLYHFPHRYLDFSKVIPISKINIGENCTISGQILRSDNIFTRHGKNLQKIILRDKSASIELVWFNQPFLVKNFKVGDSWTFAGTPSFYNGKITIFAPEYGQYNTGKIIPIYPETKGLTSRWFRKTIGLNFNTLEKNITETLPPKLLDKNHLLPLKQAIKGLHLPENQINLNRSRYRLAIDEIVSLLILSRLQKKTWSVYSPKFILKSNKLIDSKIQNLISSFPFTLTDSQLEAWTEIKTDLLSKDKVTNRLLCGDVGSGKTVIAMLSAYLSSLNQHQSIILAPTEILAQQHFQNFQKYLPSTLLYLLTTHQNLPEKLPKNAIIIATHAAIFQKDKFIKKTALLVIDEQHKFGVKQRSFLSSSTPPHTLTMTATPIPRTISLTFFGNLDLSTLKNPPQNRPKIKTFLVPQNKITDCYHWLEKDIEKRHTQAFIVCPFIEESESATTIKSAKVEFEKLKNIFIHKKLALIHGKTDTKTREKILSDFSKNKINILVTTPIIEVGIDFPNTTTIIIQSADHFGLSQLHQLRGRVGRGELQSYCYFFTESETESSLKRLDFLTKNNDGFKIAEYDLKTRGPGESFSTLQHGFPSLKIADLSDVKLLDFCQKLLDELEHDYPNFNLKSLCKNKESLSLVGKHLN